MRGSIYWGGVFRQCKKDSERQMYKKLAELSEKEPIYSSMPDIDKTFIYKRKTKGWEPFNCPCGSSKQLSPSTKRKIFHCSQCGRKIIIET